MPSQQQPNGTQGTYLLFCSAISLSVAPSVSANNEVALDPNDFPALGLDLQIQTSSNTTVGSATTSYASQAGTGFY